jgi:GNAT superfamily N-acetyltransferase
VEVKPMPGLEHLPYAEVWLHAVDDDVWREASAGARAIGKTGLEVWTTDATPEVVAYLEERGYEEVRHYRISELDVDAAPDPEEPAFALTTFAARPDLAEELYEVAREAYGDQPGRSENRMSPYEVWRSWGLDPHPASACFIALENDRVLGYGYLELEGEQAKHGFTALRREARGRGIAGAIKRAQIAWAKRHGIKALRTANELRLPQMLALNERHGYRALYLEIVLRGPLAPDGVGS